MNAPVSLLGTKVCCEQGHKHALFFPKHPFNSLDALFPQGTNGH